jgi:DNA-binding CsgD family transcriptional regulator
MGILDFQDGANPLGFSPGPLFNSRSFHSPKGRVMYLSGKQTILLGQIMQTLAEPHEEKEIREIMGDLVMQLLGAQFYASYVWQPGTLSFAQPTQINMDPINLRAYESYYQFHDPITPLMQRYQVAVRATDVLAPDELKKTEFFNDFLNKDGLYWGVNLYAWHQGQNLGDMRIWRDKRRENFSLDELRLLDMLQPAFVTALARAQRPAKTQDLPLNTLSQRLTPREQDTARLVMLGLPDKEIARALQISTTTVRTHLENAFRKVGVSNRAALVHKLRA